MSIIKMRGPIDVLFAFKIFSLPVPTRPGTRTFWQVPNPSRPDVKNPYPSDPAAEEVKLRLRSWIKFGCNIEAKVLSRICVRTSADSFLPDTILTYILTIMSGQNHVRCTISWSQHETTGTSHSWDHANFCFPALIKIWYWNSRCSSGLTRIWPIPKL